MFLNELYELREIIRSRRCCEKGSTGRLLREIGCISTRWRATWSDSGLFSRDPRTGALERERFHDRCVSTINIDQARPMDGVNKARKVGGTGVVAHLWRKRQSGSQCADLCIFLDDCEGFRCLQVLPSGVYHGQVFRSRLHIRARAATSGMPHWASKKGLKSGFSGSGCICNTP
jgi:hypothetical protein